MLRDSDFHVMHSLKHSIDADLPSIKSVLQALLHTSAPSRSRSHLTTEVRLKRKTCGGSTGLSYGQRAGGKAHHAKEARKLLPGATSCNEEQIVDDGAPRFRRSDRLRGRASRRSDASVAQPDMQSEDASSKELRSSGDGSDESVWESEQESAGGVGRQRGTRRKRACTRSLAEGSGAPSMGVAEGTGGRGKPGSMQEARSARLEGSRPGEAKSPACCWREAIAGRAREEGGVEDVNDVLCVGAAQYDSRGGSGEGQDAGGTEDGKEGIEGGEDDEVVDHDDAEESSVTVCYTWAARYRDIEKLAIHMGSRVDADPRGGSLPWGLHVPLRNHASALYQLQPSKFPKVLNRIEKSA
jgi:hypothetical protein